MEVEKIVGEIKQQLLSQADPALAVKYSRYFKEGYDAYGLPNGVLSSLGKDLVAKYGKELGLKGFLDLSDLLMEDGKYEEVHLAIILISAFKNEFDAVVLGRISSWLDSGVQNWAHTDVLCSELLAVYWKNDLMTLADIADWRTASGKWKRRAVPVGMLALLKKNPDIEVLLDFLDPMMTDSERVVHQGLGWFLRETWKRSPEPVEAFLLKWKDTAPRLIFQYATEKMSKAERERFRRAKKRPE